MVKSAGGKKIGPIPVGWLLWFVWLLVLGPVAWVLIYRFVDPPVTLNMMMVSGHPIERVWRPLDRISPNLIDAAIASEDANFCIHHGFDEGAIREAWHSNQQGKRLRGASTISMQTVKNTFLWPERTWVRKGLEAWFTVVTEALWPKRRIMEVYLNVIEWGDGIYGAEAAANHYFRTTAAALTAPQAARLVAILPKPRQWSPLSNAPMITFRAATIEERADLVRADGKAACLAARP
jgi:monofunctional biosynthetic peptidoglycan transglycosylase